MTVRRGQDWGDTGALAADAPVVDSDRAAGKWLSSHRDQRAELGLIGGDLARTVGARGTRPEVANGRSRTRLPIDVGVVTIDGRAEYFVAHVVLRRRLWIGRIVIAANAAHIGSWNVSPRSHPNDGRIEIIEATLSWADKLKARARLPSGSHLPHPDIAVRSVRSAELDLPSGAHVFVDGVHAGRAARVTVAVEPDLATIVI